MPKLKMMKGLPASGKSTLARQMVGSGKTCIRINRDDLRAMLYGKDSIWSGKKESLVIEAEKQIAARALKDGLDVVVDDTNLSLHNLNMWNQFTRDQLAKFEVMDLTTTVTVEQCIDRDITRIPGRVGRAIIENMALKYGLFSRTVIRKKITIWDVDGTLANIDHRLHKTDLYGKSIHPTALKHLAMQDKLNTPIADWFCATQKDHLCFVISGRGTDEAITTENWLYKHLIFPDRLFMRNGGDFRADVIIKQEILERICENYGKENIEFVVDDRPSVVSMWRSNGLKVYPVNQESWEGRE